MVAFRPGCADNFHGEVGFLAFVSVDQGDESRALYSVMHRAMLNG